MVKYSAANLDGIFAALADPTRRGILASLADGPRPVSALSQPFSMSLPGFVKHLDVLEEAGLLARSKRGRVVTCRLEAQPMRDALAWLERYEVFWSTRLDALGRFLNEVEQQTWTPKPSASDRRSRSAGSTTVPSKGSGRPGPTRKR